jgi:hypothetical protein
MPIRRDVRSRTLATTVAALFALLSLQPAAHAASRARIGFVPPPPGAPALTGNLDWRFSMFGFGVAPDSLFVRDLDGDGTPEIVFPAELGGSPSEFAWFIVSQDPSGYSERWVSPTYTEPVGALIVANVDADPALEVLVAVGSRIMIYDGASHALQRTLPGLRLPTKALAVADVDDDGSLEIVSTDGADLFVQDLATGNVEYRGIGLGGRAVAVGDVNGNASLEIVVANGAATGYVIGGRQHRVIWERPDGFGSHVAIADADHDGVNDIVSGFEFATGIAVFDVPRKLQKEGLPVGRVEALTVVDTDGDGLPEVIYGDAVGVHVLDGPTLAERWAVASPPDLSRTAGIGWGDTDHDGTGELVYGGNANSFAPDLYVVDGATHALEWAGPDVGGPFSLVFGDVDADARLEAVSMSGRSASSGGGRWLVHDANTHVLESTSPPVSASPSFGRFPLVRLANVDADPQLEVIVVAVDFPSDAVVCYDGLTHAEQWRRPLSGSQNQQVTALTVGDVDGDGSVEVVVITWTFPNAFVSVLNAATGAVEWQSFTLGPYGEAAFVRIANLGGATPKIVVGQVSSSGPSDGRLSIVDAVAHTVSTVATPRLSALDIADLNGDGVDEIVAGTDDGRLVVLDPGTGAITRLIASYGQRIDGLAVRDLDGDGVLDYVFALADIVYVVSGVDGHALWASEPLDEGGGPPIEVGREDRLVVTAPTVGGRFKIGVGTGQSGFAVFKLRR